MHKELMESAVRAAGKILLSYFHGEFTTELKEDTSPVTQADKESEEEIIRILSEKTQYNIIAEESGNHQNESEFSWVIDPMDGTVNFSKGVPIFAVSIALVKENLPVEGMIYLPITDELLYAKKGEGATLNGEILSVKDLPVRKFIILDPTHDYYPYNKILPAFSEYMTEQGWSELRIIGSAVSELAYMAKGISDALVMRGAHDWDYAAGTLICAEAGYPTGTWSGEEWGLGTNHVLVAHPELYPGLLTLLKTNL